MAGWDKLRHAALNEARKAKRRAQRDARARERVDLPLIFIGIAALALVGVGSATLAFWMDRTGFADPPVLNTADDDRILENFYSNSAPIIDATLREDRPIALIGRADGQVHSYNLQTGLFADSTLPDAPYFTSHLALLAAGCGGFMDGAAADCPIADQAFAVTEAGGLAWQENGGPWRLIMSDSVWTGANGTPVEQDALTHLAATENGNWLLALAGAEGAALLDQTNGLWHVLEVDDRFSTQLADANVQVLVRGGEFWIGGAEGLARIVPAIDPAQIEWAQAPGLRIRDLALDTANRLLVLAEAACETGDAACLSLRVVESLTSQPQIIGETARFTELSADSVQHAAIQNGKIVTLGTAGVHVYDMALHDWAQLDDTPVTTTIAPDGGALLVYAAGDHVAAVQDAAITERWQPASPVTQLVMLANGRLLGLGETGQVIDIRTNTALDAPNTPLPDGAVFTSGASLETLVLLRAGTGALLHDTARRRYSWIDASALPEAFTPSAALYAADGTFWLADATSGALSRLLVEGSFPQQTLRAVPVETLPAPLRSTTPGSESLSVVDSSGRGYSLRAADPDQATLTPLSGPPRGFPLRFNTATASGNQITFATEASFQTYNLASRSWSLLAPFEAEAPVTDIANLGPRLLYRSADGRVAATDDPQNPMLGNGPTATFGLAALSDAQLHNGQLYLAGAGQVQAYNPEQRAFSGHWAGGNGAVRLLGLRAGLPAWISGQTLFFGDEPQSDASLIGAWQSRDGIVAHAQAPEGAYAVFWPNLAGEPTCYFRSAQAPTGQIIDATLLPSGDVVVAANGGAGIYSPQFHRWLALENMPSDPTTRLYQFGTHLVATTATSLQSLPLRDLPEASSCSLPTLALNWETTLSAQTVAASPDARSVAVLDADGRVQVWADGVLGQLLPASGAAPDPTSLRRVYTTEQGLAFTTRNAIWHYDLAARLWQQTQFMGLPNDIIEADLAGLTPRGGALTLWSASGQSYGAAWELGQESLTPEPLTPIALPAITTPPESIRDIAQSDGFWSIASDTRLELARIDAPGFTWYLDLPSTNFQPMPSYIGRSLTLIEGAADQPETLWIFPQSSTVPQMRGLLQTLAYRYTLGDDRAYLLADDGLTLTRIAANGAVFDCPVRLGDAAPQNCVQTLAPPQRLNSANIRIIPHGDGHLVADGEALVWLNAQWRGAITIPGPAPAPDARYFAGDGGTLLLHEGAGKALWAIAPALQPVLIGEAVDQIASIEGRIFLAEGAEITAFSGNQRQPIASLASGEVLAAGLALGDRPALLYLTANGTLHDALDSGVPIVTRLEFPADSRVILPGRWAANSATPQPGYWVQNAAGEVNFLYEALCPSGTDGTPIACQKQALTEPYTLPAGATLRGIEGTPSAPVLLTDSQRITLPRAATDDAPATAATLQNDTALATRWPAPTTRREETADIQGEIVALDDGFELAPARISGASSRLQLRDSAGNIHARGQSDLTPWPALDLTWLKWSRSSGTITFNHSATTLTLTPPEALRDGQFLPALPGRAAMLNASGAFTWLNAAGLWRYANSMSGPSPVLAEAFETPSGLAHGQFLMGAGAGIDTQSGAAVETAETRTLTRDQLTITESLQSGQITATITRPNGESLNAFSGAGFAFDTRLALGWRNSQPVFVTPIGLSSLARFDGFTESPQPNAPPAQLLEHEGQTYAQAGGRWFSLSAETWAEASNPLATRRMLSAAGLHWDMSPTGATFTPIIEGEAWRAQRYGNAFTADDFRAIAATPEAVVLTSALGTHALPDATALYTLPAPLAGPTPLGNLDATTLAPDNFVIFGRSESGALLEWAEGGWQPISSANHPDTSRRVVENDDFTITLAPSAAPQAQRAVTLIDGTSQMQAFTWQAGEYMPFDRAQAIYAEGDSLLIATDFGLRRLRFSGPTVVADDFFIAPRGFGASTTPNGAAFSQVGRPAEAPDMLIARNIEGACLAFETADALPQNCAMAYSLETQTLLDTPFWHWVKSGTGLRGEYRLSDGATLPIDTTSLTTFPHDRLQAAISCNNQTHELWADGAILASGPLGAAPVQSLPQAPYMQLYCQQAPAQLDADETLEAGAYATGPFSALHLTEGGAQTLPATQSTAASSFARGTLAYNSARLRIKTGATTSAFQHYWDDGQWRPMPLQNGLPALETTLALAAQGNDLLRLTPLGLIRHDQATADLSLTPATLTLQSGPSPDALAGCTPDRIETADGSHQTSPALTGAPVQFTCTNGSTWRLTAPDQELGALTALSENPFQSRTYIDTPTALRWSITEGSSAISLQDAAVTLNAGRFSLDAYQQIAAPFAGQLELLGPAGWWSYPAAAPAFDAATRPADFVNAANALSFAHLRDDEGNLQLCVTTAEDGRIIRPGQFPRLVEFCADEQGQDAIWSYAAVPGQAPLATGTSLNRVALNRRLLAGRFADLTITSPPVYAGHDAEFGARYTLATPFGFVLADENFARLGIFSLPHRAIPLAHRNLSGASPVSGESAAEMSREVLESCPALPIAMALMPPDQPPRRAEYESDRVIRLFTARPEGGNALLRLDCQTGAIVTAADLPLGSRLRFDSVDADLPGAMGRAEITFEDGEVWLSGGGDAALDLGNIGAAAPVSILARGGLAVTLIVTPQSLFIIDTDAAITALTTSALAGENTPSAPTTPDVAPAASPEVAPEPTPEPTPEPEPEREPEPAPEPAPEPQPTPAPETPADDNEANQPASRWSAEFVNDPPPEDVALPAPDAAPDAYASFGRPVSPAPKAPEAPPRADGNDPATLTRDQVLNLQRELKARIFPALQLTGELDPSTSAAMLRYQRSISAPPTGIPTIAQYEQLTGEVLP